MKAIVEYLSSKNIICKSLREVKPKLLGSCKRVEIYIGVNLKGYYCSIIVVEKKSRVVRKEARELMALHEKLEIYEKTKILKRYIEVKAPLCSHAKALFVENGWRVWDNA